MKLTGRIQPKHLAHVVMIAFASASLFNIEAFFNGLENNIYLAWSLAIALAAVLVVMAALLSELRWNLRDGKFATVLTVTTGLTIVSGSIQGAAYSEHAGWAGWLLGFALPGLGELGLALAISAYGRSLDGREVTEAQRQLASGVRRHLVNAIANVDPGIIEKQVNRAVATVTRELVNHVVVDMVQELRANSSKSQDTILSFEQPETQNCTPSNVQNHDIDPILNSKLDTILDPVAKMNEGKQRKIELRRNTILEVLHDSELSVPDLATRLGVSTNTVRGDLEALQAAGHTMSINGVVKLSR